jgi:speckle-type POZ protein
VSSSCVQATRRSTSSSSDVTEPVMTQYEFAFMVEVEKRAPFFRNRKRMEKMGCCQEAVVNSFDSGGTSGFRNFMSTLEIQSGAIKNDSLTIRCDVIVFKDLRATADVSAPTTFVPPSDLIRHLGDLLHTGKGADVVFQVAIETFPAHRCMLAARSPVFSAEFSGTMQESTTTATGSVVQVDDMVAPVFRAFLCFLYTDSLPEIRDQDEVAMYQHLLVAADRYNVERLKLICEDKLCKNIDVPKVATILTLAEQHHCIVLKKLCLDFLSVPANLKAAMGTEGFKHLSTSCPSIKKDLDAMLAS